MNNSKTPDHPWRSRTREFQRHLYNLPPAVQRRIKYAEREYLAKREAPFSPHISAAKDFAAGMVGVREKVDAD